MIKKGRLTSCGDETATILYNVFMSQILAFKEFHGGERFEICHGDLTREETSAIVNAANSHLEHGGGVAAAIVSAGGWVIQEESRRWVREHGPVAHDSPAVTQAGKMRCRYVIHAVGPIWGEGDEEEKLASALYSSMNKASELNLSSVAFPPISTGIFGFPKELAAKVIFKTIERFFTDHLSGTLRVARLTIIDQATLQVFLSQFEKYTWSSDIFAGSS